MRVLVPIRSPGDWPLAQRDLMADLDSQPRTAVVAEWWWNDDLHMPVELSRRSRLVMGLLLAVDYLRLLTMVVVGAISAGRRAKRGPVGAFMLVRRPDPPGCLVFPVDHGRLPSDAGVRDAVLVGEFAPNGALAVILGGVTIPPIYNPVEPWGDLAKRSRILAEEHG